jgi:hypothetical protein
MKHIVLTSEQARVLSEAGSPVEVRDADGRTVAHLTPLDPADVEAIERFRRTRTVGEPRVPSAQVQAHLRRLEEIRQQEGMDEAKMLDLLKRMRAGEPV